MISFHSLQRCVVKPTAIATASSAFAAFRASFLGATTRATLDQIQINISRGETRDFAKGGPRGPEPITLEREGNRKDCVLQSMFYQCFLRIDDGRRRGDPVGPSSKLYSPLN